MSLVSSTLTSAAATSSSALATLANETAIVSRNIAGASNPNYARRIAQLATGSDGAAQVTFVARATDTALRNTALGVSSNAAAQKALADGYDKISTSLDDSAFNQSPSAAIADLGNSLQQLASSPGNLSLAEGALRSAKALAANLNTATNTVQGIRKQADGDIAASVARINGLLKDFQAVDAALVKGAPSGADVTSDLDRRDEILASLANEIGITATTRPNGSTQIYTDSGAVLFDKEPRSVTFASTTAFSVGVSGQAVYVDNVDVTSSNATQKAKSGAIAGLAAVRDQVTVQYQSQLDETARGLIDGFAEADQSTPATRPDAPGLFTYPGAPALTGAGLVDGLAGTISVNPSVDPAAGGDLSRIRDGGSANGGDPAYGYNASGAAGFTARITALIGSLSATRNFDPQAGITTNASLSAFAIASINSVEGGRKAANDGATQQSALLQRTQQALQGETGVNLDDELSKLLDLEHAYGASAKLLSAVDTLYTSLFQALN